ncbi:MAG: ATP-binding protein [Thermodesulfovibrionales bacterium]|nr:ATP-binding protein [Thermodesulfovibrionales bacterium]
MDIPFEKLFILKERLGISDDYLRILDPFRKIFTDKKEAFSSHIYNYFSEIPDTRIFLEHYERPGFLKKAWANWFEYLFNSSFNEEFLSYLWRIGKRHVEVNLDQRYSNLGFSIARQYCHRIIQDSIPAEKSLSVSAVVNRLIDFCLLVETSAYIHMMSRCDMELIMGIADRIRNKITVIGGNIKRLSKKVDPADPDRGLYDFLISQSSACENIVFDIRRFFEIARREPEIEEIPVEDLVKEALKRLRFKDLDSRVRIDINLRPEEALVLGDRKDLSELFYEVLSNSFDALTPEDPYISIKASSDSALPGRLRIEIFNRGIPPRAEDIEKLFTPFFSTKPLGSGFGLAIAQMAARKNYGKISIEPVEGKGTRVIIVLPAPLSNPF